MTDVGAGAGAGAQSRAADAHLVLREHAEPGCVVVEAVARSWKPPEPICLRREFPVWQIASDLDPVNLAGSKPTGGPGKDDREEQAASKVRQKMSDEMVKVLEGIDCEKSKGEPAASKSQLKIFTEWQTNRLIEVIDRLLDGNIVEEFHWNKTIGKGAKRAVNGYRRWVESEQSGINFDHRGETILPDDNSTLPDDPGSSEGTSGDHRGESAPFRGGSPDVPDDREPRISEDAPKTKPKTPRKKRTATDAH